MAKRIQSPSSINTFKQCKRKYYYQYIAGLPTLPNIHQVRGNIAHSTLENFYDIDISSFDEQNYALKIRMAVQQLFLHYWKQYQDKLKLLSLHPDQERFYFEETMLMIMNWTNHFLQDIQTCLNKDGTSFQEAFNKLTPIREQKFISDNYSVQGFVDAIHHLEDEVHIIDYKTNSNFEFKDSIRLQLAIYCLLYHEKYGKIPSKVGIFFLRHKLKLIDVDPELLDLAKREIELIHAHTSLTEDIKDYPKFPSPLCKWSTGKCDFYDVCLPHSRS
ncbi:PD-(D/E)XK nuclease family protein [Candidatus Woesearchaeota archaeon]|nr:PD-(D/E)XK nuclease family protein [Candidatus Woesearchaeota archaeon]